MGTYMHGMFESAPITKRWLQTLGLTDISVPDQQDLSERDRAYTELAAHFRRHIDTDAFLKLIG